MEASHLVREGHELSEKELMACPCTQLVCIAARPGGSQLAQAGRTGRQEAGEQEALRRRRNAFLLVCTGCTRRLRRALCREDSEQGVYGVFVPSI